MPEGEWFVAGATGGRRKHKKAGGITVAAAPAAPPAPTEKSIARHKEAVETACRELSLSPFYSALTSLLQSAQIPTCAAPTVAQPLLPAMRHLLVYGLGSLDQPGAVHIRYQLALACRLSSLLSSLETTPEAFDPAFTPHDHAVLPLLSFCVCPVNEGGRRVASQPTFFFMPHCEAELTDALVQANEEAGTLLNVVILGNSFEMYRERWGAAAAGGGNKKNGQRRRPDTLLRLCNEGRVVETSVSENGFPVTSAFNDMSLHWFTRAAK